MNTLGKKAVFFFLLLALSALLFKDSFTNFFYQDDFFNISLANRQGPLAAFNLLARPPLDFYFYRPLTTQFFWWLGQRGFGLNPVPYHFLVFIFFLINIILVFVLARQLVKAERVAILATFFYALSASHFYRLFFLSQFQEILLTTLVLATLILYIRGSFVCVITIILALTAKETAIVVPLLLIIYELLFRKRQWRHLVAISLVVLVYLFLRNFYFGFASGSAYDFDLHPKSVLNNFLWYSLWSLGLPEAYVNLKIFTFPTIINPKFLTEFGVWGNRTLLFLLAFLSLVGWVIRRWLKASHQELTVVVFALAFFGISLLPVAFFPFHKFAYSLTLPLFGAYLALGIITSCLSQKGITLALASYLLLGFSATQFNLTNHWTKKRADTAAAVWQYLATRYPNPQTLGSDIYFVDETVTYCWPKLSKFRQSEEIAYALGGDGGLKLLYNNPDVKIYFADWDNFAHLSRFSLVLDSRQFLP